LPNCSAAVLTALTERLHAKPVRIVFDFVLSLLGERQSVVRRGTDPRGQRFSFSAGYLELFNISRRANG